MKHSDRVLNYYNATYLDYRVLWSGSADRAIHFGYYDEKAKNHRAAVIRLNEVLASKVGIQNTDTVLDAGCGYGGSALWLAKHLGCSVTGITLVPFQVEKGQRYAKERGLDANVQIFEMDFSHTSFPKESFEVYWALESLVHAENRDTVLLEASRVLKPNGRIVIAEYTLRENPPLASHEKSIYRHGSMVGQCLCCSNQSSIEKNSPTLGS
jgi:tocopherol O-methyltransferase